MFARARLVALRRRVWELVDYRCAAAPSRPQPPTLVVLAAMFFCAAVGSLNSRAEELRHFLTAEGDQLMDGDEPFRFVSFNVPNLLVVEDEFNFRKREPFRWPDEFEIEDGLESVRQIGGRVVRTYVISVLRDGSEMGRNVHVLGPGEFNEEAFRTLDKVLEVANRKGIRVIIPLVDQWKWMGGIEQYAAFRGKEANAFWSDPELIVDFKKTIEHVLNRKNTYTGVAYRDDRAIFGWETGNEIDSTAEWTREIAAYIKSIDKNHLVIDGRSLDGVPEWSLADPNVDVITTHHYPHGDGDFVPAIRAAKEKTRGKKPYFVGEFGFVPKENIAGVLDAVVDEGVSGALLWSLRFHRREGGFYWHMEVGTGRNHYKAFHWPGFASGDNYEERAVLELARKGAFAIRGMKEPAVEAPATPKLLPIERVSAISWQGAAGAETYDVLRSCGRRKSWVTVGHNVSDAAVQYRPLFNDEKAILGEPCYYQVVARNAAGRSAPSNIVGPVFADSRTLVDECADLSRVENVNGDVTVTGDNARIAQEDCHRFAMKEGAELVYHVDRPISDVRVYTFARDRDAELQFSKSMDGANFEPIEIERSVFVGNEGDYGYLTPVLYETTVEDGDARTLKIALAGGSGAVGTEETAPVEVSRVEIEYDRMGEGTDGADGTHPERAATPLNTTIFVGGGMGFLGDPVAAVDKAAALGNDRLNVVVTILVDLNEDLTVKSYGQYKRRSRGYQAYTEAMREDLKDELRRVFARMVELRMDITVLPHIDAGGEVQQWRNWVDFDPTERYAGYSYEELMIDVIVEALAETVDDDTHVELALSGEMGTSLFKYPQKYLELVARLREKALAAASGTRSREALAEPAAQEEALAEPVAHGKLANLKIGVSLNHGQIAGESNPRFVEGETVVLSAEQRGRMQELIDACDFVGISFYRPVNVDVSTADFERGINSFMDEFKHHGLEVPKAKALHFSEVGIGGGHDGEPTDDPAEAVETPWEGTGNPLRNPWSKNDAMRDLRRRYHGALLEFLMTQPTDWQVSGAYFWSMGSWDPQGMQNAAFADTEIIEEVRAHNRKVARPR